jgi:hypothetical protein
MTMTAAAAMADAIRGTLRPLARNAAVSSSARNTMITAAKIMKIHLSRIRLKMNAPPKTMPIATAATRLRPVRSSMIALVARTWASIFAFVARTCASMSATVASKSAR